MLRRKWTFLVVAAPLLASLYLPAQGAAAPTDLEKKTARLRGRLRDL
jgi:hypothetical protein